MVKTVVQNVTVAQANAFTSFAKNSSYIIPGVYDLSTEDTNWVLTSSFIIFTMQTGTQTADCEWISSTKLTYYALYRIRHARVGLCFGEERSEHHDEKYRGYCFGRLHVLAIRLWNVLWPWSTVESIHCHWRLFTRSARRRSTHGTNIR